MSKKIVLTAAILICLSIILGAMAAHALEKIVSKELIETFEKGVKYQLYIGLGLLALGLNVDKLNFKLNGVYLLNLIGVILFSGSIYLYTFHGQVPGFKSFVHLVPLGGTAMIIGWITFIVLLIIKQ